LTAAEQRAREVAARRGPRRPRDPDAEQQRIAERTLEVWVDEGAADVRGEAAGAAARAASPRRRPPARRLDPAVVAAVTAETGDRRRSERVAQRLAAAEQALQADRLDEARRLIVPLLREVPGVAAVHEVAGLVNYRLGRWRDAVRELEAAQALHPRVDLLPVLADSYRALKRWSDVERIWASVREISPAHEVLAEARIVAAGAQADRGDLAAALRTMGKVPARPRRVRPHHLRLWYVLGDLHDRAGNPLEAAHWFERVADEEPDFVDVGSRLRALGRS
jgi:tetratricopeptide (TPR) repeat protein